MRADRQSFMLARVRGMIDSIDDAMVTLLASRRLMVPLAAELKGRMGAPARDARREMLILRRARHLGHRLGVPGPSCDRLMAAVIADACMQQHLPADPFARCTHSIDAGSPSMQEAPAMPALLAHEASPATAHAWLRWLPPPHRLAPLLSRTPLAWQMRALQRSLQLVLSKAIAQGALADLESRRLGIDVTDLGLRWVISLQQGRMHVDPMQTDAESTVRGTATDLLLLASRREDADTLFFQRRLILIGDTELGLTVRNLLDQLPWHDIPLGLRIILHRAAGLAQAARHAYRGHTGAQKPLTVDAVRSVPAQEPDR